MTQQIIPLAVLPRQSFSIRLDDHRYEFRIYEAGGMMCVDITRDDVVLITGTRAVASRPLLPYDYQSNGAGNFAFATDEYNRKLPWWEDFESTCRLIYDNTV